MSATVAPRVQRVVHADVARGAPAEDRAGYARIKLGDVRHAVGLLPAAAQAEGIRDGPVVQELVRLRVEVPVAGLEVRIASADLELEVAEHRQQNLAVDLVDHGFALGLLRGDEQRVWLEQAVVGAAADAERAAQLARAHVRELALEVGLGDALLDGASLHHRRADRLDAVLAELEAALVNQIAFVTERPRLEDRQTAGARVGARDGVVGGRHRERAAFAEIGLSEEGA